MKRHQRSLEIYCYLVTIIVFITACNGPQENAAVAAKTGSKPPMPHMWISDSLGHAEESNFLFMDSVLTKGIGEPEPDTFFYALEEFRGLVDTCGTIPGIAYLDILPIVPTTTGKLDLIFQPRDVHGNILANFMLPPKSTVFDRLGDSVPPLKAEAWSANYAKTVVKMLNPWLDSTDPYNYLHCDSTNLDSLSNTVHMAHDYRDYVELDSEFNYQTKLGNKLSGVMAILACKPFQPKGTRKGYSNRLFPILEFTTDDPYGRQRIFSIADSTRSLQPARPVFGVNPCKFRDIKSQDNGQMCPPTCNP